MTPPHAPLPGRRSRLPAQPGWPAYGQTIAAARTARVPTYGQTIALPTLRPLSTRRYTSAMSSRLTTWSSTTRS